jgi:hypothetical protein
VTKHLHNCRPPVTILPLAQLFDALNLRELVEGFLVAWRDTKRSLNDSKPSHSSSDSEALELGRYRASEPNFCPEPQDWQI